MGKVISECYLVLPPASEGPLAYVSEAQWHIVERQFWDSYKTCPGYGVAVFRPLHLAPRALKAMLADGRARVGQRYAWWRMFTFLGEKVGIPSSKLNFLTGRNVCSTHAGLMDDSAGIRYCGRDPKRLDPDYALDCVARDVLTGGLEWSFVGWSYVPLEVS